MIFLKFITLKWLDNFRFGHILLRYFHMSVVWAYVSLWLFRMFVAGADKVEGNMRWCVRTNEILTSNMTFTRLKVKQGHFETSILTLHMFHLLLRLKVFRSINGSQIWKTDYKWTRIWGQEINWSDWNWGRF